MGGNEGKTQRLNFREEHKYIGLITLISFAPPPKPNSTISRNPQYTPKQNKKQTKTTKYLTWNCIILKILYYFMADMNAGYKISLSFVLMLTWEINCFINVWQLLSTTDIYSQIRGKKPLS